MPQSVCCPDITLPSLHDRVQNITLLSSKRKALQCYKISAFVSPQCYIYSWYSHIFYDGKHTVILDQCNTMSQCMCCDCCQVYSLFNAK